MFEPVERNTPTCVGKTGSYRLRRACAEETPPRAWGRRTTARQKLKHLGNTPTCVGKTEHRAGKIRWQWKHPHVRGEDNGGGWGDAVGAETPPRAWGRLMSIPNPDGVDRNTPTCVGKTFIMITSLRLDWKHPHVRGEDETGQRPCPDMTETPPRAWGRLHHDSRRDCMNRNTPTCVGKTMPDDVQGVLLRNTPTCVGKTRWPSKWAETAKKHPHVRGEDTKSHASTTMSAETPPRAWGRLKVLPKYCRFFRNTPTCVGKTLRDYSLFLLSRQNNIETSSFSDTSCSPDNSMSWRFGSPMP